MKIKISIINPWRNQPSTIYTTKASPIKIRKIMMLNCWCKIRKIVLVKKYIIKPSIIPVIKPPNFTLITGFKGR
ncbi:MAG: hypothetical protein ACP5RD_08475, partial [bacterium]